jgi:prepilin-type N-terminal cleavage/methylation domain-containing protein
MKNRKGFTLIELIIVIAIIAVLAAAIFVAIDPARRLHESRNARRSSDVATILEAVKTYQSDNEGTHYLPVEGMTNGDYYVLGTCNSGAVCTGHHIDSAACIDLSNIGTNYLAKAPKDPSTGTDAQTAYYIMKDANGAVTVGACATEGIGAGGQGTAPEIEVAR